MRIDQPFTEPVVIAGQTYSFPDITTKTDGNRVWSLSVVLARQLHGQHLGKTVELGAGLGLIAMVTGAVIIERDPTTVADTITTQHLNNKFNRIIRGSWDEVTEPFDSIIGCEVVYPAYDPDSITRFIQRNWTRKGICLFANSHWHHIEQHPDWHNYTIKESEGQQYAEWRVNG